MQSRPFQPLFAIALIWASCAQGVGAGVIEGGHFLFSADPLAVVGAVETTSMPEQEGETPVYFQSSDDDLGMLPTQMSDAPFGFPILLAAQLFTVLKPECTERLSVIERLQLPPPIPISLLKVPIQGLA